MLYKILYALVVAIIYLLFNYDLEKTVAEQTELFYLSGGLFAGFFILFHLMMKPKENVVSEYYGSESSYDSELPFPE